MIRQLAMTAAVLTCGAIAVQGTAVADVCYYPYDTYSSPYVYAPPVVYAPPPQVYVEYYSYPPVHYSRYSYSRTYHYQPGHRSTVRHYNYPGGHGTVYRSRVRH